MLSADQAWICASIGSGIDRLDQVLLGQGKPLHMKLYTRGAAALSPQTPVAFASQLRHRPSHSSPGSSILRAGAVPPVPVYARMQATGLRKTVSRSMRRLLTFINEVLAPLGRDADAFWQGFATVVGTYAPQNKALLARRDDLQARIDAWHERAGRPGAGIPGLPARDWLPRSRTRATFAVTTKNVDREIAAMAGAAAGCAGAQCPLPAQCRQCALGQPL